MAMTLKLAGKDGVVKKISADDVYRPMTADGMWYSSSATEMAVGDTFSIADEDFVLFETSGNIEIEFEADSSGDDGQGLSALSVGDWTVTKVTGNVVIARAQDIPISMVKPDIFKMTSTVAAVGDSIDALDCILADKNSSFIIKITPQKSFIGATFVSIFISRAASSEY